MLRIKVMPAQMCDGYSPFSLPLVLTLTHSHTSGSKSLFSPQHHTLLFFLLLHWPTSQHREWENEVVLWIKSGSSFSFLSVSSSSHCIHTWLLLRATEQWQSSLFASGLLACLFLNAPCVCAYTGVFKWVCLGFNTHVQSLHNSVAFLVQFVLLLPKTTGRICQYLHFIQSIHLLLVQHSFNVSMHFYVLNPDM